MTNYNPFQLPSKQGGGGGIHVKTYFMKEVLESGYPTSRLISDSAEIEADIVIIDPIRFAMDTDDFDRDYETVDMLLAGLESSKAKKILTCTELSLMRIAPEVRHELLNICHATTASCKFQNQLLRCIGIYTTHILRDAISDIYCSPVRWSDRKNQVVAIGQISWEKNAQRLIEIFKALKGKTERVYIGSHSLWHQAYKSDSFAVSAGLQEELYDNCDIVVPECTIQDLAKILYKAKFGVWVATHDTTATGPMSMLRAGMSVMAAPHGYAQEIPVRIRSGLNAQVNGIKKMINTHDETMDRQSRYASDWCEKNVSYPAIINQLDSVLKTV